MSTLTTYKTAAASDRAAIIRIITGLGQLGWAVYAHNNGETETVLGASASPSKVADLVAETDLAYIRISKANGAKFHKATLMFVLGNAPDEVLADCSMSGAFDPDLEAVLAAANLDGEA